MQMYYLGCDHDDVRCIYVPKRGKAIYGHRREHVDYIWTVNNGLAMLKKLHLVNPAKPLTSQRLDA